MSDFRPRFLAVFLLIAGCAAHNAVSEQSPGKWRVNNPAKASALIASGARLLADYGSFMLIEMDAAPADAAKSDAMERVGEFDFIQLNATHLNTRAAEVRALRKPAGKFSGKRLHLVQFIGPVKPEWFGAMQATGARVVHYLPENSYLVQADAGALERLQVWAGAVDVVQWEGPYADEYKIHPTARGTAHDSFSIQLFKDAEENPTTLALLDHLKLAPFTREFDALHYHNVILRIPPGRLAEVAARPDVVSIQPYLGRKKFCERQDQILAGNLSGSAPSGPGYLAWLAGKGFTQAQFTSSAFLVDVTDSGVDDGTTSPNHFGLFTGGNLFSASRMLYARLEGFPNSGSTLSGCDGHGTLNAHIIGGYDDLSGSPFTDASGYHYGLGVCPFVRVGSSVVFDPDLFTNPDYNNLQSRAYNSGARISNNSWGGAGDGTYDVDTQNYDALVRDAQPSGSAFAAAGNQEMVIVFAAGNDGPSSTTIGPPGSGKNIISVGAAENVQAFGGTDGSGVSDSGANNANDVISFSGRGPCTDGRVKPDICAPGTHVSGGVAQANSPSSTGTHIACYNGAGVSGGSGGSLYFPNAGQEFYTASSGTSHAAPAIAGCCALVRQYFINQSLPVPSPAMTKAFLMNSARYLTGANANDTLPSNTQGMGDANLGMAFDGVARVLREQSSVTKFTASGQTRSITGTIADVTKPFRVTLAWTDAPGATSGNSYNNNLDLTVTVGGSTYRGNVFSGANSVTGGSYDLRNNVESVFRPSGVSGTFTVTVTATSINSDGVPNEAPGLDQDFALVIYNAVEIEGAQLSVTPAGTLVSTGPAGGAFSPTSLVYTVSNPGTSNLDWSITKSAAWLTLSADSGTLAPGSNTTVNVSINAMANSLAAGAFSDTLTFSNLNNSVGNTTRAASLTVTNPVPALSTNNWTLSAESCANGAVDPGESVSLDLALKNLGTAATTNLVATLQSINGVTSPGPAQNYGVIPTGGSPVSRTFTFSASGSCGGTISPVFQLQDGAVNLGNVTLSMKLGAQGTFFSQNFDGVIAPVLPAGWTTAGSGGQTVWTTSTSQANTAPNAAFSIDSSAVGVNELVTPVIAVSAAGSQLSFRNSYNLEASSGTPTLAYDGAVLEIKIGGGAFTDIVTAGGSFVSGGYTRTISSSFSNPLAGRSAWSGNSGGFILTTVNLPVAAAGQNIQLRWRCGTDSSAGGTGWFVDSITLAGPVCCSGGTAPVIVVQPQSQSVLVGAPVNFSVTAVGGLPLGHQWLSNGVNIAGATLTNYSIASAQLSHAADYSVVVTNSFGSVTSAVATLSIFTGYTGVLAGWDTGGLTNFGTSPLAATTNAPNLTVIGLTRGPGVTVTGTAAVGGWGGNGFDAADAAGAILAGDHATLGITAASGYKVSFSSVSAFNYRRSSTGATSGVLQFQLGAGAFTDVAALSYPSTSTSGASLGVIDLSTIPALQNIGAGVNVTFRIVNFGATTTGGTWYLFDVGTSSQLDFALSGNVSAAGGSTAAAPLLTALMFTNNQFQFTLTGSAGSNYVVQASTHVPGGTWLSLVTNTAPFNFIETNTGDFPSRFYRGLVWP